MAGHVREGRRRYVPELAATGVLHLADWVRDDLPDLLWPALLLAHSGSSAAQSLAQWQGTVLGELDGELEPDLLSDGLDGRLTSLDRLATSVPHALAVLRDSALDHGLLPRPVVDVLASYPEVPAAWLTGTELQAPTNDGLALLSRALREAISDGHREALLKCLPIWSAVQAGVFRSDSATIELLKTYPADSDTRNRADSVVRASWGAMKGAILHKEPSRFDESIRWAKVFWGVNSMTTRCIRKREVETGGPRDDAALPGQGGDELREGDHLQQLAMDLVSSFVEALETAPSRLYDPERQEVHAGLVCRAGREVITALGCRDLWCLEHGSHVGRILVETRIYLQWMGGQEPEIYHRFQEFGAGKAKLYSRILDEVPADARNPEFAEALGELGRLSHNDDVIDHRIVDTSDSFSGKSIRAMAEECGLLDFYRQSYSVASGVAHSEWWSVETHALERCLNVLHRGHLIPSLSLSPGSNVALAQAWVDQLNALMRTSLRILGTEPNAIAAAFAWLDADEPDGPAAE